MVERHLTTKLVAFLVNAAAAMGGLSATNDGVGQAACIVWFFAATLGAMRYAYLLDLKNAEGSE